MTRNSPYASPSATIRRLEQWDLSTKKSLGQHFLVDDGVIGRILRSAELSADDQVLEIGPGIGTLTEAMLLKGAHVFAVEKDARLTELLADTRQRYPGLFDFCIGDAVQLFRGICTDEDSLTAESASKKLIANLPYAVAATLVLDCFRRLANIQDATVMVQKEVAERMSAKSGTKNYGAYTVKLALLAEVTDSFVVPPTCFLPPPRVDSTVICLKRKRTAQPPQILDATFFVVEAAFAKRRKTIRNSMRAYYLQHGSDADIVDELLEQASIVPTVRGEALSPEDYLRLGTLHHRAT